MSTKFIQDIPDICAEEICVSVSEETVSAGSDDAVESGDEGIGGTPKARGRADSGALLDMLAEVASQKLLFSPMKRDARNDGDGKLSSAKGMSTNQLIELFSTTEFDEMKKWYTYHCAFDDDCKAKFFSFGNENKAKETFKQHLLTHMTTLKSNETVSAVKRRSSSSRRPRKIRKEIRSSFEKIEVKEEIVDIAEDDWNDHFMLPEPENKQAEFLFEENGPKVEVEIVGSEVDLNTVAKSSAAVDLNKLIAGLSEKMGVSGEHSYSSSDPVLVYVLDGDTMVLKNVPPVAQQVDVHSDSDYAVVRSAELPVIANKRSMSPAPPSVLLDPSAMWELNHGENIERDEFQLSRKPKGKAKFIGQSKIEKEKALAAIEAIRLKTGGGGIEALQCDICQPPRTFTAPTTLISHYRSHAGIKPYECRVCQSVFTRQHSLNYHMLIHTNQTRFTCQDCGRKFRHPSHFREHRRRHTGESPFECSDCLMRFKTRNTYKRHLRTRHGKVLTTSGGLIILSEDEFQMVRTSPRSTSHQQTLSRRGRPRKPVDAGEMRGAGIDAIDEDIQALHQLEIVTTNEGYEGHSLELGEMPPDFLVEDGGSEAYEEIVKEAVRLERAEAAGTPGFKTEEPLAEETLVIETEDPLSGSGLYLATLEDGETVLVNTRDDDSDGTSGHVDLGFKLLEVGKVRKNSQQESTVIVIKNESFS